MCVACKVLSVCQCVRVSLVKLCPCVSVSKFQCPIYSEVRMSLFSLHTVACGTVLKLSPCDTKGPSGLGFQPRRSDLMLNKAHDSSSVLYILCFMKLMTPALFYISYAS
ncbi:hypothetical protein RRG08_039170 [Elysia crispata]|uniref:Uncharacterized protein n=1 Tax=Elysia crispata TaxID=231223 RepID=A0AAE1DE51_9GAST|nr:hypothetical protein RRG08_039170 [Elysia crispata]